MMSPYQLAALLQRVILSRAWQFNAMHSSCSHVHTAGLPESCLIDRFLRALETAREREQEPCSERVSFSVSEIKEALEISLGMGRRGPNYGLQTAETSSLPFSLPPCSTLIFQC